MTNKINIRKATLADVANLTVLKQQVWIATYAVDGIRTEFSTYVLSHFTADNTTKILQAENMSVLIAEQNGHLLGCIEIDFTPPDAIDEVKGLPEITVLYVLERFCGSGIGSTLQNEAINLLKSHGYSSVWLSAYSENLRALKFYEKNGFKTVGKIYFEMDGNKYENKVVMLNL